jgi:threonine synthase
MPTMCCRDFFAGGDYSPRASLATLANAMDVGAPSNFERLRWIYRDDTRLRAAFRATSVGDDAIRHTISDVWKQHAVAVCPHTATALSVCKTLRDGGDTRPWAIAATAHPAKFESIVEPLIGTAVEPPPALAALLQRPATAEPMAVDYAQFVRKLREN